MNKTLKIALTLAGVVVLARVVQYEKYFYQKLKVKSDLLGRFGPSITRDSAINISEVIRNL